MGDVGNFIFGGSSSKQKGKNQYESSQQSTNASQNSSVQASASGAENFQKSGGQSYNQAYAPMAAAMTPALGYTTQAGDMMGALLGLTPNQFSYSPSTPGPLMPSGGPDGVVDSSGLPGLGTLVDQVKPSVPAPPPGTVPPVPTTPTPGPSTGPSAVDAINNMIGGSGGLGALIRGNLIQHRATGGPVTAGQPYVVGENQPELFVPQQSGTILPSVPGQRPLPGFDKQPAVTGAQTVSTQVNPSINPASALNNWSDAAGMNFILDQGQKAIAGASGANGTFNSGATGKALTQYGQNIGKTYLNDYMGQLMNYGQLGLGAGSALANAGGINVNQSLGGGSSLSNSAGVSQGTSFGQSTGESTGNSTTSGKSSSKKGLL